MGGDVPVEALSPVSGRRMGQWDWYGVGREEGAQAMGAGEIALEIVIIAVCAGAGAMTGPDL